MGAEVGWAFEMMHTEKQGVHILEIIPVIKNDGYPPLTVAITTEQWDAMRFHFMVGYDDKAKVQKVGYVY